MNLSSGKDDGIRFPELKGKKQGSLRAAFSMCGRNEKDRPCVPLEGEDYAELLGLIGTGEDGMSYGDAMMLLTQYRSALAKFRRK